MYVLATAWACSVQNVNMFVFSLAIKIERLFYLDTFMIVSCFLITAPLTSVSMAPSAHNLLTDQTAFLAEGTYKKIKGKMSACSQMRCPGRFMTQW